MDFPQWLTRELQARGMGVRSFAAATGVVPQTAYNWRNGAIRPDTASCKKIAAALGYSEDFVLERAGHKGPGAEGAAKDPRLASLQQVMDATWHELSEDEQVQADNVIRVLFTRHRPAPGESREGGGLTRGQFDRPNARKRGHDGVVMRFRSAAKPPSRQLAAGMRG